MKKDSSKLLLLDVNVLLALAWPNHPFHAAATRRMEQAGHQWATCALTQLGFIRLSSNPAAVTPAMTPASAATLLAKMVQDAAHVYVEALPQPVEFTSAFTRAMGHRQVIDFYLLYVARLHKAKLLTFDARLRTSGDAEVLTSQVAQ